MKYLKYNKLYININVDAILTAKQCASRFKMQFRLSSKSEICKTVSVISDAEYIAQPD